MLAMFTGAAMLALAQGSNAQEMGWYIGATIGQSKVKEWCDGLGPGVSCSDTGTAWRVLGGYQVNRNFAAELGYHDLGSVDASDPSASVKAEANAWELVALGQWPFTNQFSVYGKAGLYRGEVKASATVPGFGSGSTSETNTDITYGVGVRFDLNRNLALRGEWQRYTNMGDNATIGESDVDVLSLGVLWKF
jgi:OOP family OmpA-OmpF porin